MLIELVAQWINVAFFILPNAVLLARPCDLFTKLVREAPSHQGATTSEAEKDIALFGLSAQKAMRELPTPCSWRLT